MTETNKGALIDCQSHSLYEGLAPIHRDVVDSGGAVLIDVGGNTTTISAESQRIYTAWEKTLRDRPIGEGWPNVNDADPWTRNEA